MKTISRTIESCKIEAEAVFYNEKKEFVREDLPTVITTDKEEKVRQNLSKYFKVKEGQTPVIKSVTKSEKVYEVPVDEFIKLAESLEKKEETKEHVKENEKYAQHFDPNC